MEELAPQELTQIQAFSMVHGADATEMHRTLDFNGEVINQIVGGKHGIHLSEDDEEKIKPMAVEIHNHPRFGGCFSPADIVACKKHNSRMVVVNNYGDIFYMKTSEGDDLKADGGFLKMLKKEYYDSESAKLYSEELEEAINRYYNFDTKTKQRNRRLFYRIQREASIMAVMRLARKYRFTFRHFKMDGDEVLEHRCMGADSDKT